MGAFCNLFKNWWGSIKKKKKKKKDILDLQLTRVSYEA